jgi:hypothetical protein
MAAPSEEKLICDIFNLEAFTNRNPWLAKMRLPLLCKYYEFYNTLYYISSFANPDRCYVNGL